jgi:hypothetical protein
VVAKTYFIFVNKRQFSECKSKLFVPIISVNGTFIFSISISNNLSFKTETCTGTETRIVGIERRAQPPAFLCQGDAHAS